MLHLLAAAGPPEPPPSTSYTITKCDGDPLGKYTQLYKANKDVQCYVTNWNSLSFTDVFKLKNDVLPVAARWKAFGLALGLPPDLLDRIDRDHKKVDECLQALLQEWVTTTETRRGPPSWQLVIDAVASPAGGNNQALAQQIARQHNGIIIQ